MFRTPLIALALSAIIFAAGCRSIAPETPQEQTTLKQDSERSLRWAQQQNVTARELIKSSPAYAVFPRVGKGALIFGAGYGKGVLYEHGRFAGFCDARQFSVGGQIGGQAYTQLLFFQNADALARFKQGEISYDTQVGALAVDQTTPQQAHDREGITLLVLDAQGLMAEAAVGAQKFRFLNEGEQQQQQQQ